MSTPLVAPHADQPVVPLDGHRANLDRDGFTENRMLTDHRMLWDRS